MWKYKITCEKNGEPNEEFMVILKDREYDENSNALEKLADDVYIALAEQLNMNVEDVRLMYDSIQIEGIGREVQEFIN